MPVAWEIPPREWPKTKARLSLAHSSLVNRRGMAMVLLRPLPCNVVHRASVDARTVCNQVLCVRAQTDTLRIYVTVPQTQSRSIAPGQSATVSVREIPDKTFNAKVVRTSGALDPASRTLLTELQLPNSDGQLFPGMYAEVKFALPQDGRTLLIPGNAVMVRSDGPKVLVIDAKQTIHARPVKLGRDLGDKVEIASGLNPAESLVANPTDALRDGTEVKVQAQPSKGSDQQVNAKPTEKK